MILVFDESRKIYTCSGARYEDSQVLGRSGAKFVFDSTGTKTGRKGNWWTDEDDKACKLRQFADGSCKDYLDEFAARRDDTVSSSRRTTDDFKVGSPGGGVDYLPFQRAGIRFLYEHANALLGDPMGLGKTIEILGLVNVVRPASVLGVVPASLKINWATEARKWLVEPRSIITINAGSSAGIAEACSKLAESRIRPILVLVNYDIMHREDVFELTHSITWDLLFCDEAHYLKNPNTKRAIAVLGKPRVPPKRTRSGKVTPEKPAVPRIEAARVILATGTPFPNKPIEIQPLAGRLNPEFASYWGFARKYCNSYTTSFGIDVSGSSNLHELQERLRSTILIRREKAEVLTELPPKIRQVIDLPQDGLARVVKKEQEEVKKLKEHLEDLRVAVELAKADPDPERYREAVGRLSSGILIGFREMSRIRAETAIAKIPKVVEYLIGMLDGGVDKVIVFAHHREVIERVREALIEYGSVLFYGGMSAEQKNDAVESFMREEGCRVFVGSMQAAGIGLTLTAASHVVFVEQDWVPGTISQAEDRAHRIGQEDCVWVLHLVVDGSIDSTMAKRTVEKQKVIDAGLDDDFTMDPVLPTSDEASTVTITRKEIQSAAENITDDQKSGILEGLRLLSGNCDGAKLHDGVGFSGIDSRIGKDLAECNSLSPAQAVLGRRLLVRYRNTQLPKDLAERIWK